MKRSIADSKLRLTPTALAVATIALAAADVVSLLSDNSFFPGGPADETAHFLTTLLVLWALGRRICQRFLVGALIASVAIDLDHVPGRLGLKFMQEGTPRPYTHSLLSIALVMAGACLWRSRRDLFLGTAFGLAIHFWRDLADPGSGVALLWPFSYRGFSIPHASYLLVLVGVIAVDAYRSRSWRKGDAAREPLAVTQ